MINFKNNITTKKSYGNLKWGDFDCVTEYIIYMHIVSNYKDYLRVTSVHFVVTLYEFSAVCMQSAHVYAHVVVEIAKKMVCKNK